jgi:hypothetical protein
MPTKISRSRIISAMVDSIAGLPCFVALKFEQTSG